MQGARLYSLYKSILEGSWDLVSTCNGDITLLILGVTYVSASRGMINRVVTVVTQVISAYYVP